MSTARRDRVDAKPDVLFIADVAARLRCSSDTIRRRLRDGTFPVAPIHDIDKRLRFPAPDIDALAAGRLGVVSLPRRRAS